MTASGGFERFLVELGDGRSLDVGTAGPVTGLPLVFHTGTPAGLTPNEPLFSAAAEFGLRTVQYSRPGYGRSAARLGRRVGDAAADVAAILDHLGLEQFVTAGWSGGGPHALACAALLPDRCLAAATIAGVAPYDAAGLDWLDGMARENIDEFGLAVLGEEKLSEFVSQAAATMADATPELIAEAFGDLVTAPDKAAMTGDFASFMCEASKAAISTGIAGWRDDDLAFITGWGFEVTDIAVPVAVWQGDADAMVPFAHGAWLAASISGAKSHLLPGHGHLTLVADKIGEIVTDLVGLTGQR
ncbi:MAG TPA: alpha/beta hydrolase [Streptosporangiaceae bacterium]|nr:alpha/beta hydrolase [Streptosporangiaceae bacterium]